MAPTTHPYRVTTLSRRPVARDNVPDRTPPRAVSPSGMVAGFTYSGAGAAVSPSSSGPVLSVSSHPNTRRVSPSIPRTASHSRGTVAGPGTPHSNGQHGRKLAPDQYRAVSQERTLRLGRSHMKRGQASRHSASGREPSASERIAISCSPIHCATGDATPLPHIL